MNLSKVLLVAACVAAFFLGGCEGKEERKAKYLEKAKVYMEQENYNKARIELKNVLQIDPKHAEAYYLRGVLAENSPMRTSTERNQAFAKAFSNYKKAVELDPNNMKARIKLGKLHLLVGNLEEAENERDLVLEKLPDHPDARLLAAATLVRKGDRLGAISEANSIISTHPEHWEAVAFLASLYKKDKEFKKALEVLNKGVMADKNNIALHKEIAQIYGLTKEYDKAALQLKKIVSIEPEDNTHRVRLAMLYSGTKQIELAEKTLREMIRMDPEFISGYLLLADFFVSQGETERAMQELIKDISDKPDAYQLRFGLAKLYIKSDSTNKAISLYKKIIDLDGVGPDGIRARNEMAKLVFSTNTVKAKEIVEEILQENPKDNDALILKGRIALKERDPVTAINALRVVLNDQPDLVEVSNLLAGAHMLNQNADLAEKVMLKTIEANPDNDEAKIDYIKSLMFVKKYEDALAYTNKALDVSPKQIKILEMRAALLLSKNNQVEAQETLEKIRDYHPDEATGYKHLAELFLRQGKYNEGIEQLEMAIEKSGELLPYLAQIVKTYIQKKEAKKAADRLNIILSESPENAIALELLGEVYFSEKKNKEAEEKFHQAIKYNSNWDIPYYSLSTLYITTNNLGKAIEICIKGLTILPDNLRLRSQLAGLYEKSSEYDKAIEEYKYLLNIKPGYPLAANNLATILSDYKGDRKSLEMALELSKGFEQATSPALRDTLGWVYFKLGDLGKAITILTKVVEDAPQIPHFQYHLGRAYYEQGKMSEAHLHLSKSLDSKLDFPGRDEAIRIINALQGKQADD